jgi:cytochrome c
MLTRKSFCAGVVLATGWLAAAGASRAADNPTQADVQQVTLKAAAFLKEKGVDAARSAFDADGEFKYGEIYVCVVNEKGVRLIYPPKPAGENLDVSDAQDVDGKYLIRDILEVAKTKGEGWTQYRWTNPATNKIAAKMTFVKALPESGLIVYAGLYK